MPRPAGSLRRLLQELRRRGVGRVVVAYAVSAWVIIEVADVVFPRLNLPDSAVTFVIVLAGVGFPIAGVLAWLFHVEPERPADAAGPPPGISRPGLRLSQVALGLLILTLVGGITWRVGLRLASAPAARAALVDGLVVLPFESLSDDPEQEYFVDGMHDALITQLAQVGGLRVISRTSALRYRSEPKTVQEIARELNVGGAVEATVLRMGDSVRIQVQLVQAEPLERHLWAQTYEGPLRDVLTLHADIARSIAGVLQVELTPDQAARLSAAEAVDPETFEAYLRGMHRLRTFTPDGIRDGLRMLHAAVERDPGNARAWAGLALGYTTLGHGFDSPPDAWTRARAAAERARRLDPDLAEAHAALARVKTYFDFDWEGAELAYRRAIELNPSLATNHYHYAWYLVLFARWDEAVAEHERARDLDPLVAGHSADLAGLYTLLDRPADALREARKAVEMAPRSPKSLFTLGDILAENGMYDEAIATHEGLVELGPPGRWILARSYALAGRTDDARRLAHQLEAEPNAWNAFGLAVVYAALGDPDRAFHWLDYRPAHAWLPWVGRLYWTRPLHDDPRMNALLESLGLPPVG